MLKYKASYKFDEDGWVVAQALDFPGAVTQGQGLDDARRMLQSALVDLAETYVEMQKPLPVPNSNLTDHEADLEEPVYLLFQGASQIQIIPAKSVT